MTAQYPKTPLRFLLLLSMAALICFAPSCDDGAGESHDLSEDSPQEDQDQADQEASDLPLDLDQDQDEEINLDIDSDAEDLAETDLDSQDSDLIPDLDEVEDEAEEEVELTCSPECGDFQDCVDGSCVCQEGYGDCNDDPSDGCEQALDQPLFCGVCAPGNGCELPGTLAACVVDTPGQQGYCDNICTANHFDIDQDLGQPGSNGCEFALLPQTNSDLAGELGGTILDLELDGQKLFVLYEDGTQHIAAYDLQDPTQLTLLNTVDLTLGLGSQASLAAHNNILAVTCIDNIVSFLAFDGSFSPITTQAFNGVLAVEALDQAQMPDALAGFLAYGPGVTRYAVFAAGDEPTGFSCFGSSTHEVCTTSVSSNPAGAHLATMGQLAGKAWTLVLGEAAFREFKLDALGQAIAPIISGDAVDLELDLAMAWSDGFIGAKGAELLHYTYSYTVTNDPETRTQSSLGSLAAAATAWALLGGDILAYAHSGGLSLHALDTTSEHELSANPVDELEAEAGLLVSRSGGSVRVYSYE